MNNNLLASLPQSIADQIKVAFPELRVCKGIAGRFDLERLKKDSIAAPAVLVSHLGSKQGETLYGTMPIFELSMVAYVVTRDRPGLLRDVAAANITQVLLSLIPENTWQEDALGAARDIRDQTLVTSKTKGAAASLWAVTWVQPVTFTAIPTSQPVTLELYLGQSPAVGGGQEANYTQTGGGA